jgi:hypothetical protein
MGRAELLFIIGAAGIVTGAALVFAPAAFIVGGALLCWLAYKAAPLGDATEGG